MELQQCQEKYQVYKHDIPFQRKQKKKINHRIVFDFLGTVQFLYNFIEGSPIRHATLEKISKESCIKLRTLKSLSNTRWACSAEAVSAVQENVSMLVPAIDEIFENTQVPDVRAKGLGLKYQLKSFNFVFAMNFVEPIFRAVLKVSASLQAPVLDLLAAYDNIYQTTIDICNKNKIDIPEVLKRKVARKIDDNEESQFFSETKYDEIRINVFYPILDDLLGEINNRFLDSTLEVITSVGNLIKLQPTIEDYSIIKNIFNILNKDVDSEVKILASIQDIPNVITKFVVIPVTSCGCEWAFSKLSIVKSKLRSTMSQERLESLLFLFVEQEMTKSVDFNSVIEEFIVLSPNVLTKNRLTDNAIPTFFNDDILAKRANCDEADSTVDLSTPLAFSSPIILSNATPRKLEFRKQLRLAKDHIRTLENRLYLLDHLDSVESFLHHCEQFLSPNLILIIKSHLMQKERKKGGYRFNNEMKQFALTIYFLGPKVYSFIKTTLSLPTISTLKCTTSKFEILPCLNDFLFNFINFKTRNYTPEALQCILCADEMSLKTNLYYLIKQDEIMGFNVTIYHKTYEPAKYALVLMLSGINVNLKQPIAYFLVSSSCTGYDLQDIIISTIIKIQSTSLDIKAFIIDMGSNFVGFSNNFHVSPSRPYFEVNNKKIVYIFDPPHFLKATRNFTCNLRFVPKLTYPHLYPNAFQKMRVYLAAQTFSATVAAGMETYLELNKLPISSKQTIIFLKIWINYFDDILSEIPDPSNKKIQNIMFPEKSLFKFKTPLSIGSVDYRDLTLPDQFINICLWLFNEEVFRKT
ncbi:hypothetical protein AGLY_017471 [Aphis glycines]|uniref:Uncharacterized protein n=1 Tax=Aphis glycines TaxID=307491 RepID=A0A6G0SWU1_APHGL|nr:hypothetical protein AGLY_017471 [Aphis glycines]